MHLEGGAGKRDEQTVHRVWYAIGAEHLVVVARQLNLKASLTAGAGALAPTGVAVQAVARPRLVVPSPPHVEEGLRGERRVGARRVATRSIRDGRAVG